MNKAAIIIVFGIIVLLGAGYFFKDSLISTSPEGFEEEAMGDQHEGISTEDAEEVIGQLPDIGSIEQGEESDSIEENANASEEEKVPEPNSDSAEARVVSYTASGFEPSELTINLGESVRWVNQGDKLMWVASDNHPTHRLLPEFDDKRAVGSGAFYEFTFTDLGQWDYHNHVSASDTGTIIVK